MASPLMLYSAQTLLAYLINQKYYGERHWVWCSPYSGFGSTAAVDAAVPPSSSPLAIYRALHEDVKHNDHHSAKIEANRQGLVRGANLKLAAGAIDNLAATEIGEITRLATVADFRPLLHVIPYALVDGATKVVPVAQRAHPLSEEFQIESLSRRSFDIIELPLEEMRDVATRLPCLGVVRHRARVGPSGVAISSFPRWCRPHACEHTEGTDDPAKRIAVTIAEQIERQEGQPVAMLDDRAAARYVDELSRFADERTRREWRHDEVAGEAALARLRSEVH